MTTVTTAGVTAPLCPAWKPRSRTGDKLFEWTENIWIAVRCGAQLRDYGVLHRCTARVMAAREPKLNAMPGQGTGATIFHGIFTQHTICTLWPATVLVDRDQAYLGDIQYYVQFDLLPQLHRRRLLCALHLQWGENSRNQVTFKFKMIHQPRFGGAWLEWPQSTSAPL